MEVPELIDIRIFFSGFKHEFYLSKHFCWLFKRFIEEEHRALIYFFLNVNCIYKNSNVVLWINYELGSKEIH